MQVPGKSLYLPILQGHGGWQRVSRGEHILQEEVHLKKEAYLGDPDYPTTLKTWCCTTLKGLGQNMLQDTCPDTGPNCSEKI